MYMLCIYYILPASRAAFCILHIKWVCVSICYIHTLLTVYIYTIDLHVIYIHCIHIAHKTGVAHMDVAAHMYIAVMYMYMYITIYMYICILHTKQVQHKWTCQLCDIQHYALL